MSLELTPGIKASRIDERAFGEYILHKVDTDSTDLAIARGDVELTKIRKGREDKHLQETHAWQMENQDALETRAKEEMERDFARRRAA